MNEKNEKAADDRPAPGMLERTEGVMKVGIAADHAGFALKDKLIVVLRHEGYDVCDFGARAYNKADDYPDFTAELASALCHGDIDRGVLICGSGIGMAIAANKFRGVRAAVIHNVEHVRRAVAQTGMNALCLAARSLSDEEAIDLAKTFLVSPTDESEVVRRRIEAIESGMDLEAMSR